jgi:predicted transposase YbfD/YdcC
VDTKTNEIPVARRLCQKLDLDGRTVSLDALHTQAQTARELVLEHGADFLLTVKDNQPTVRANIERLVPAPPARFSPRELTPTLAARRELNRGQPELRVLRSRAATPEEVGFPCVEQVALLRRHLRQHTPEVVALLTSRPPSELNAAQWLAAHRDAWGIESGLHQRLDVSHREDACRVRRPKAMRVMAMFRRLSNSLFMEWRSRQKEPGHKTTTDFFSAMNAEHHRYAIRCLNACHPSFQTAS